MPKQATAEEDPSASLTGAPWRLTAVKALPRFRLRVRFRDGLEGTLDLDRFVHAPDAGVFAILADPARFANVGIEEGVVTWQGALEAWPWSLDLAPDAMHAEIRKNGEWVL